MKNLVFIFTILCVFQSCSKEQHNQVQSEINYRDLILEQQNHKFDQHDEPIKQTVLGGKINNPFSVGNMLKALESLCGSSDTSRINITATDRHIKFNPKSLSEVKKIFSDTSLIVFDFPLDREIIELGDYYSRTNGDQEIPSLYSIVESGQSLPDGISYDVLEEYAYLFENPLLIAESFRLTGNMEHLDEYVFSEDFEQGVNNSLCGISIEEPIDCPPGCYAALVPSDEIVNLTGQTLPPFVWQCKCVDISGPDFSDDITTGCGCDVYSDQRKPGGCILVENTSQQELVGVDDVKVCVKNYKFGKWRSTWTDSDGCWKIDHRHRRRMWMRVSFVNADSYERCYNQFYKPWQLVQPVKDPHGPVWGPRFNDIEIVYNHWGTETGTRAQQYWGAATINNQVKIFNAENDINDMPSQMDIYMLPNSAAGSAILSNYVTHQGITQGVAPDLTIGLDFSNSIRQDRLSYHEMAHASHYTQVGTNWWINLIEAEATNSVLSINQFVFDPDPYGNGTAPLDGYIAVAESWAEHIGVEMSTGNTERLLFRNNYIPEGLYNDLIDAGISDFDVGNGLNDNISGYTRAQLFNALTSDVNSISDYREKIRPLLPPGNTMADFDELFDFYIR